MRPHSVGEVLGAPRIIIDGVGQRLLGEFDLLDCLTSHRHDERKQDVGALDARGNLREQRPQELHRSITVTREPVIPSGSEHSSSASVRILPRGHLGGELAELSRGLGRAAAGCVLCGVVERRRDRRVWRRRGAREVAGPLFDIGDSRCQRRVRTATPRERRSVVTDGGEQRMREANARPRELDEPLARRCVQRFQHTRGLVMRCGHELNGGLRERCDEKEHVSRFTRQPVEAIAQQLLEAFRDAQRPTRQGA